MKAISLWQPWATGIALLLKRHETRGWATKYRGPIAIHAALRWEREQQEFAMVEHTLGRLPKRIPRGAIVCIAVIEDCLPVERALPTIGAIDKLWGNYSAGRYAWCLSHVVPLLEPLGFKGRQGFFEVPDELLRPLAPAWYEREKIA